MERMFVARRNGWTIEGFARMHSVPAEVICRLSRGDKVLEFDSLVEAFDFADQRT
jgi:hypothetical protein